jgi:hypothetical protein
LIDANGLPIVASRQDFVLGLTAAEGATIDPVTGDFLFSTFGSTGHLIEVRGFAAGAQSDAPEPTTQALIGMSLAGLAVALRWRIRRLA